MLRLTISSLLFAVIVSLASAFPIPGADVPSFYLIAVATGTNSVRPVLLNSSGSGASLQGPGQPIQNYIFQGQFRGTLERIGEPFRQAIIDTGFTDSGTCATFGKLLYLESGTTNKCASHNTFGLQSHDLNAQLGSKLTFNWVGGFYSCGPNEDIWYKKVESEGPTNCYPVDLYTVPVV